MKKAIILSLSSFALALAFASPVSADGPKKKKVTICHKGQTIEVSPAALAAHLGSKVHKPHVDKNGKKDSRGACDRIIVR